MRRTPVLQTVPPSFHAVRPSILGEVVYHDLGISIRGSYLFHMDLDLGEQAAPITSASDICASGLAGHSSAVNGKK